MKAFLPRQARTQTLVRPLSLRQLAACEYPEPKELQNRGQSSVNHVCLDEKALKMTASSFSVSKDCSGEDVAQVKEGGS